MKLAYKLSSHTMLKMCVIISEVTRPCWNWYTENTTTCKTPRHAVAYAIKMVNSWCCDNHLLETLHHSLYCISTLQKCDIGIGLVASEKQFVHRLLDFSWSLIAERVWSPASRQAIFSCRIIQDSAKWLLARETSPQRSTSDAVVA